MAQQKRRTSLDGPSNRTPARRAAPRPFNEVTAPEIEVAAHAELRGAERRRFLEVFERLSNEVRWQPAESRYNRAQHDRLGERPPRRRHHSRGPRSPVAGEAPLIDVLSVLNQVARPYADLLRELRRQLTAGVRRAGVHAILTTAPDLRGLGALEPAEAELAVLLLIIDDIAEHEGTLDGWAIRALDGLRDLTRHLAAPPMLSDAPRFPPSNRGIAAAAEILYSTPASTLALLRRCRREDVGDRVGGRRLAARHPYFLDRSPARNAKTCGGSCRTGASRQARV